MMEADRLFPRGHDQAAQRNDPVEDAVGVGGVDVLDFPLAVGFSALGKKVEHGADLAVVCDREILALHQGARRVVGIGALKANATPCVLDFLEDVLAPLFEVSDEFTAFRRGEEFDQVSGGLSGKELEKVGGLGLGEVVEDFRALLRGQLVEEISLFFKADGAEESPEVSRRKRGSQSADSRGGGLPRFEGVDQVFDRVMDGRCTHASGAVLLVSGFSS